MKKKATQFLCLLTVFMLVLSGWGTMLNTSFAEEEEIFPDNSICLPLGIHLGAGEPELGEATRVNEETCVEGVPSEETLETFSAPILGESISIGADGEEFFPEGSMSIPADVIPNLGGAGGDGQGVYAAAAAISASQSRPSIKVGETTSVTYTISGYSGSVYLQFATNNTTAYSLSWGSWAQGSSIPLRITGNSVGSGIVTVYMKSSTTNQTLAYISISVEVKPAQNAKISLSTNTVNVENDRTASVRVTISDFSGSVYLQYGCSNSSVMDCWWDSGWDGNSINLYITGKAAGKGTITIYMKSSDETTLTTASISVSVYFANDPKLTLSSSSVSMKVGNSVIVNVTASGYYGEYYLQFGLQNSSVVSCQWGGWSGSTIPIYISGQNSGSSNIYIYMKDKNGSILKTATISTTVISEKKPELLASRTSVQMAAGASESVVFTIKNTSSDVYLQYSTTNDAAYSCAWDSGWKNNSISLTIRGKSSGTGTVTVYMKDADTNQVLDSKRVNVTCTGISMRDIAFGFHNFSQSWISMDICQYMFGSWLGATAAYLANIGDGGVCFGMATAAALLDVSSSAPNPSTFGRQSITDLERDNRSSGLNLTVEQFIEAMHLTQMSTAMTRQRGLSSLVSTVKTQINNGLPVAINIRGIYNNKDAGHTVLAFGYTEVSSTQFDILIYDSNSVQSPSQMEVETLTVSKSSASGSYNSWSYNPGYIDWGTGKKYADISFIPYSTILSVWNQRGSLQKEGWNLLFTSEDDFTLYNFNGEVTAKYVNGSLVQKADDVIEVMTDNLLPGSGRKAANLLYVPIDLYTVNDDSPDTPIDIFMADNQLSVRVSTETDTFTFGVEDASNAANALLTPEEGVQYSIIIGSSRPGEPAETRITGLGTGRTISVGMQGGSLSLSGAESAEVFRTNASTEYTISARASVGGQITPDDITTVQVGENLLYTITADATYAIRDVYVDGVSVGAVDTYYFENVDQPHSIYAEFSHNINTCDVVLSENIFAYNGEEHCPTVTVTDVDGNVLTENKDYEVSYAENIEPGTASVIIIAKSGSGYFDAILIPFYITTSENQILSTEYDADSHLLTFYASHEGAVRLIAAGYNAHSVMLWAQSITLDENLYTAEMTIKNTPALYTIKLFMTDSGWSPLCPGYTISINGANE